MNKEEVKKVKLGDIINLIDLSPTPGRSSLNPGEFMGYFEVRGILTEESGYRHFDIGLKLPNGETPLKSRDTGEEIDSSDIYWLHPSRFEIIKTADHA